MGLSNYLPNSRINQPGVCTSTTRPASPYEGQVIYETDTDRVLVWNGTGWYPNWNTAWGVVSYQQSTTTQGVSTTEAVSFTCSFTAITNRRYKFTYFEPALQTPAGAGNYVFAKTRLTNTSGTQYSQAQIQASGTTQVANSIVSTASTTLSAGSVSIVSTLWCNTSTCNAFRGSGNPAFFLVEDIGPA